MVFASQGITSEVVVFNGRRYRRYPNAKQATHRKYFSRSGALLHRDIWEFHNGTIPAGHQIHHKNGDPSDNRLENLECVSVSDHKERHKEEIIQRGQSEQSIKHLEAIRRLAAVWHASPEGIEWHKKHAANSIAKRDPKWRDKKPWLTVACEVCKKIFETKNTRKSICSTACTSKKRNDKQREEQLSKPYTCLQCNKIYFTVQKRKKFCGRVCGQAFNRASRKASRL